MALMLSVCIYFILTASFPLNSTAEAYDTQESAVSSENLSAQTENTIPTTTVGTGFMERIDVFPFEFEVTDAEDGYVTAIFIPEGMNGSSSSSPSQIAPTLPEYEFYSNAEDVSHLLPKPTAHMIRMQTEVLYAFEYSYTENGNKVYYNGNIEALSFDVRRALFYGQDI